MGQGYERLDVSNNIANGNVADATDIDLELDGIEAAFDATLGHTHDGTTAEGGPITKVGPAQDITVSVSSILPKTTNVMDLGSDVVRFKDFYLEGNADIDGTFNLEGVGTFQNNISVGGTLGVTGLATFDDITVTGTFSITDLTVGNDLDVTSGTTTISDLVIPSGGTATFTGNTTATGTTTVANPTAGGHALNRTTGDTRYAPVAMKPTNSLVFTRPTGAETSISLTFPNSPVFSNSNPYKMVMSGLGTMKINAASTAPKDITMAIEQGTNLDVSRQLFTLDTLNTYVVSIHMELLYNDGFWSYFLIYTVRDTVTTTKSSGILTDIDTQSYGSASTGMNINFRHPQGIGSVEAWHQWDFLKFDIYRQDTVYEIA